jgi:LIVCS family branched-chain amino acid:cation transporter
MKKVSTISLGIAIFTMFFGAGNIIFPLILGRETLSQIPVAIIGFILTAVFVPILGLLASTLFEGNYQEFLNKTGKISGFIVVLFCMLLMGIGAAPRCLVLSYAAVSWHVPHLTLPVFTMIAGILIFFLTFRENKVVDILGKYLGPIKLILLLAVVVLGLFAIEYFAPSMMSSGQSFTYGLEKGYYTIDLLSGIFFAKLIYEALRSKATEVDGKVQNKKLISYGMKAGVIGGSILAVIYIGFGIVAAAYGKDVINVPDDQLLAALTVKILGSGAGVLANAAVAVACLATAITIITVCADYISFDLFKGKIKYIYALTFTILLVILMANLGFKGIMNFMGPMAVLLYPSLIVISVANILNKLFGFKYVKTAFFATLIISTAFYIRMCIYHL